MKSEKEVCAASPNVSYNDALFARIAALEQKIDSMQINDRSRSKFRNHHRNISQSRSCSIKRLNPKAYQPQCNVKVDRLHRSIKAALKAHNNVSWSETLPTVLLSLRTAVHDDTNYTIAEMVYGENIKFPGEIFEVNIQHISPGTSINDL
ncbi:retrovirus-related Pol polyprotein from transposon 412 [Nephila pilipes]|uniref:Retrovirus-related Pol polyprotein from transposon 412 n=1 Tax=Nephila pilipes TaxID=299642 RepID=A0A8X6Q4X7_NEPPI|nr:retrovirus-related Pol polyprotein from transposon 412 [Nephila pilipes]